MTVDTRLVAVGTILLLASAALLTQTAIDGRLPVLLAGLASLGALAAIVRQSARAA